MRLVNSQLRDCVVKLHCQVPTLGKSVTHTSMYNLVLAK